MAATIVLATALDEPGITESDRLYAEALERRGCRVAVEPAVFMEFDPPSAERFAEATLQRL